MKRINQYKRKIRLKPWFKVILIVTLILSMVLSIIQIGLSIKYVNEKKGDLLYSYEINQNIKYNVELFENNFVDELIMDEGKTYISDLVEKIDIEYKYAYLGNVNTDLKYDYYIEGKLIGQNSNSLEEVIWERNYDLKPISEEFIDNGNSFVIEEDLVIDYPIYKQEVINFKKKFGISLTNKLSITMTINVTSNNTLLDSKKMSLIIPVGVQAFSITKDYKENFKNDIYDNVAKIELRNVSGFINGVLFFTVSILLFAFFFKLLFNRRTKNNYNKKLGKILKNYGNIIVEINNTIVEDEYQIVNVKSFKEMVDLEEELRVPIIFSEVSKDNYGIFTLINDKILYKYILQNK